MSLIGQSLGSYGQTLVQQAQNGIASQPAPPEPPVLAKHLLALQEILCDARGIGVRLGSFADRLFGCMPQDQKNALAAKDVPHAEYRMMDVQGELRAAMAQIREHLERVERFF